MDKHKQPKRQDEETPEAPERRRDEPERRYPDANRPDALRPGQSQREDPDRPKGEGRTATADQAEDIDDEDVDLDDEDLDDDDEDLDDDVDIDDEPMPARPVK